jgi:TonB family protein
MFPRELRSGVIRSMDKQFSFVLLGTVLVVFPFVYLLSKRPVSSVVTQSQVAQIQERYARLVLNQPKPEPPKKEAVQARRAEKAEEAGAAGRERTTAGRETESLAQRTERRERTSEQRAVRRQQITRQIASVGIFAAITSSSDEPASGGMVRDLIGTGDVAGNISDFAVSGKSFTRKDADASERGRQRRETRAEGGSIAGSELRSAESAQVERRGDVGISEKPQEIEGEAVQSAERTYQAIGQIIKEQQARLKYVFEKFLKRDPNLSGKLLIRFTILANGTTTNVSIVSSSTGNPEFDETISRYVKRWEFSAIPETNGSVTVVYPFVFTAVGG